ncbi:hypothetical protein SAMN02927923_04350 [Microvirga guangxiensis]|uniref:Uncharacterized protein n=1 Tax=Microvirga guangxiensis TaxID=549386 RepID=A0A1G5LK79_9HYPH|nr:hypothetical protein SAMN02927923_04350 [Microvirga guangxiensis]
MRGFKSLAMARVNIDGIEMMRKRQAKHTCNRQLSLAEQSHLHAA